MKNPKPKLAIERDTTSSRSYPGQAEGDIVAKYLNHLPRVRAKQHPFLRSLTVLRELAQAVQDHDMPAIDRLRKAKSGIKSTFRYLIAAAMPKKLKQLRVKRHKEGLLLQPTTPEGRAAVAVLVLDQNSRVDRVRECRYCQTWFYARFKHQKFCSYRAKKCQWKHFHSDDWRKQNRERNRKYQASYRQR